MTRGIKDTSRQGRWHNERFRALGEELGLTLTHHPKLGWSVTTVPDTTREHYREAMEELAFALVAYHRREPDRLGGRKSNNNGLSAECDCGRKIRVARSTFEAGPIYCGNCGGRSTSTTNLRAKRQFRLSSHRSVHIEFTTAERPGGNRA
ncbi:hypothetical protein ACIRRA_05565 [Nocardia sp. NPDC101769]|uniref:hypothetical protein n=1 Tax=Nocardia sp. NPDC101769 TaxID=3364333 RepID=UPI00381EBDCA